MNYVTNADIDGYLNMENAGTKFSSSAQNSSAMESVRVSASALVAGSLPVKYHRFQKQFSGYILTSEATEGDTTFALPRAMWAPTSVSVWVNLKGVYRDRKASDAVSATIVEVTDGDELVTGYNIVLDEPLSAGDKVYADIFHSGLNPPQLLRKLALDCAISELVSRKPMLCNDPILRDQYQMNANRAADSLNRLSKGQLRISEWDDISDSLIPENRVVGSESGKTLMVRW